MVGRFGRIWKGALLLGVGAVGGGAALAVASVPDSSGVIHACYEAIVNKGITVPVPTDGNVRIIDSSVSGDQCTTVSGDTTELPLNWSVTGPQGATGPAGPAGAPGQTSTSVVTSTTTTPSPNHILTVSISPGTTVTTPSGVIVASGTPDVLLAAPKIKLSAAPIGKVKLGPLDLDVLQLEFASSHGHQLPAVLITLGHGSLGGQLLNGRTYPTVSLEVKKNSAAPKTVFKLSNVFVASVEQSHTLRTIILDFTKVQISHLP